MMEVTVIIEKEAESATVRSDGLTDVLSRRTITDKATGEVIVCDVVRETVETHEIASEIERLRKTRPEDANSPA